MKTALLVVVLLLIYAVTWAVSSSGWGYAGHGTYRDDTGRYHYGHGPSFFYWGGSNYYGPTASSRTGSVGGAGSGGLGPSSGK